MQRGWCRDGFPTPKLAAYYGRRVEGGVSMVITEANAIDHPSATAQDRVTHISPRTEGAWTECVSKVHAAGGHILLQLWHEGALREEGTGGPSPDAASISPSGLRVADSPNGREATTAELAELKDAYVRSAECAQRAGADGVEVHAAHGFLLHQFLSPGANRRTDCYGGKIENRARFPLEIVEAIRAATGPGFILSLRFSQFSKVDYSHRIVEHPAELETMLRLFARAGVDVVHASARRFYQPEWEGSDLSLAGWVKRLADMPVIAVGSVGLDTDFLRSVVGSDVATPTGRLGIEELKRRCENHEFDLVAVGRSIIADPDWVHKAQAGRIDEIRSFVKADLDTA